MAAHHLKRLIDQGRQYEDLPISVRKTLSVAVWKSSVKEHCMTRGLSWSESIASTSCGETEYYEDLIALYTKQHRLFPYHLSDYICTGQNVKPPITPFKYYSELMLSLLKSEIAYYQVPNFTAADMVRVLGIGRNEYIAILNACKAKRLLWRVNKGIAREKLPTAPVGPPFQPWWVVNTIALQEADFRLLLPEELHLLTQADLGELKVRDADPDTLSSLYQRGLLFIDVPVNPDDKFVIPPLEGFVSNRDADAAGGSDPLEGLLYDVFVANSERASVAQVAAVLDRNVAEVQQAMALLCRLGFASKATADDLDAADRAPDPFGLGSGGAEPGAGDGEATSRSVAVILDAEATSYLMMGALSPGVKKHSVTLFEGGRIMGQEVIADLILELRSSAETGKNFEGEMQHMTSYAAALSMVLSLVKDAAGGAPIELLRKESLAGLNPASARRVLSNSYFAVLPITPLPPPPLPLAHNQERPVNFGPTAAAATPWLTLALYAASACGPVSLALMRGQRVWRLPPPLASCSHALLWAWNGEGRGDRFGTPQVVEAGMLLWHLNDTLTRTAVLLQPLHCRPPAVSERNGMGGPPPPALPFSCWSVPLPLTPGKAPGTLSAVHEESGEVQELPCPASLIEALSALGMRHSLGYLRVMGSDVCSPRETGGAGVGGPHRDDGGDRGQFEGLYCLPLHVQLGMPLHSLPLCSLVSQRAGSAGFLEPEGLQRQLEAQLSLNTRLQEVILKFASQEELCGGTGQALEWTESVPPPCHNLEFDGKELKVVDMSGVMQGGF